MMPGIVRLSLIRWVGSRCACDRDSGRRTSHRCVVVGITVDAEGDGLEVVVEADATEIELFLDLAAAVEQHPGANQHGPLLCLPDGRRRETHQDVRFYRSLPTGADGATDLTSPWLHRGCPDSGGAAIVQLTAAEEAGANDLAPLKDLLGFVAGMLARTALDDATTAVEPASNGQQRQLDSIAALIAEGDSLLQTGQHVAACDRFRQAAAKAVKLIP